MQVISNTILLMLVIQENDKLSSD